MTLKVVSFKKKYIDLAHFNPTTALCKTQPEFGFGFSLMNAFRQEKKV